MEREKIVFSLLKPLDIGMDAYLRTLKKLNLFEPVSNLTMHSLKKLIHMQYWLMNDLRVEDANNVPDGGVVFAINHQSWADVQVFASSCPRRVHFIAKAMFKKWPVLRHLIEINGGIYIDRSPESREQTKRELGSVIDELKQGKAVGIFPEGTIPGEEEIPRHAVEPATGLLKGKTGAVRLAIAAQVPIVPVGLSGTGRAFPPEIYPRLELLRLPATTPIKVKYGQPIYLTDYYGQDLTQTPESRKKLRELTDNLMLDISKLIDHSMHYVPQEVPIKPLPQYEKLGVLLLHGFTSSLDAVNNLVPYLQKAGLDYEMPVLRGHGSKYQNMTGTTAQDWYEDAEDALLQLKQRVDKVVVVGFSMGGLLAIDLAIRHVDKIAAIITAAAALKFADPLAKLAPVMARVVKYWPSPNPFNDPKLATASTNYKKFATDAFCSLYQYAAEMESKLAQLTVPIRILQSKKDQVIAPLSANIIYENVSSKVREIVWFKKSGHEMMRDLEADPVCEGIMDFAMRFQKDSVSGEQEQVEFLERHS